MADPRWQHNIELKADLQKWFENNLQRKEVLHFVKEKYPSYAWSLRTLVRRLKELGISYIDYNTSLDRVEETVRKEMDGSGQLLGYRALHKKIREVHGLMVPRNLVYATETTKPGKKICVKVLSCRIMVDKGTDTTILATMYSYLRSRQGDLADANDSVMYSPSTQNKIEQWWREFVERMERYFKHQLNSLVEDGQYDRKNATHRLNLYEFGSLLKSFGLVNAINLDGGGSAIFVVNGTVISYPSDECDHYLCARKVTTILCVHDNLCKPTDCSGHGTCDADGHCVCDKPWTGPSCSQQDCNSIVCTASELYNATLPDLEWACHSNSSNCSRNETTKTLIKKFLLKNYAWLDALLGISLIVNFILLIILFCGNSTNQTIRRRPSFSRKDDEMRLLTSNNYDDDEI